MLEKVFIDFGYTKEDYLSIRKHYSLNEYTDEKLLEKFKCITNYFLSNGYSKNVILKMTKFLPTIYCLSIENIKQKIEDMISLGYSKDDILKMTKLFPSLYGYSIETIKQRIVDMINLGYSKEDVLQMTKYFSCLYGYSIYNIRQKIGDMISLGYSKDDVLKMSKSLPSLYSLSIENIKQKIDFYDSIGLNNLIIKDSRLLMQSTVLSYARYEFYLSKGIIIDMNNYKKLFISNKQFEQSYGMTKEELLNMYSYDEKENKNGRTFCYGNK